ncbi:MAG: exodeoxyribonuclease VII large subunit [Deltaproteobacteria bacterium]|nr:exodeoxyribonuclease VII large subunit [Deltaproteobacteria bacterium]
MPRRKTVLTVKALVSGARRELEGSFGDVAVQGEIASLTRAASGHLYFTLKDEAAQVRCVMFRTSARFLAFDPAEGTEIVATGRLTIYEPRGDLQLGVETLAPVGAGALAQAFERLKLELAAKGYFDAERKVAIPDDARCVGVVTSLSAAALFDALRILLARQPGLRVIVAPTPVQGAAAPAQIAGAIELLDRRGECDVILVVRGGGSPEDLWAFNDPEVVRAVAECRTPIVSGIGHEIDVTLCDLAADLRAATPTHAAQASVPDHRAQRELADRAARRLGLATMRRINLAIERHDRADAGLRAWWARRGARDVKRIADLSARLRRQEPRRRLATQRREMERVAVRMTPPMRRLIDERRRRVDLAHERLRVAIRRHLRESNADATALRARLDDLSPTAVLARGYAIVRDVRTGRVARRAGDFHAGDAVAIRLASGELDANVTAVRGGKTE